MHVVLPEVDGRLFAGLVSFKSPGKRDPDLQFSRFAHRADAAHRRRGGTGRRMAPAGHHARARPRVALVLSTYPGKRWTRSPMPWGWMRWPRPRRAGRSGREGYAP
jgi:cobaltochelatase CobN